MLYAVGIAEYTSPCGGKLGVVTDTTGVARGCVDWELLNRWVFNGGIMPLLEGGMTTRRSGLRLFMPRLPPPGGGGDFVGITLLIPFPPVLLPSKPGEAREFTNPFPTGLEPAPFGTERSVVDNIPLALPVLGGL